MRYRRTRVAGASYFFTLVTEQRRPIFRDDEMVRLFQNGLANVKQWHPFIAEAHVILPDHLHVIWTLPDGDENFSTRWRLVKEVFTRAYLKINLAPDRAESRRVKGEQAVWQRRFWEHLIRDDADFSNHLDYIHLNPVHHGYAKTPGDSPHSSFAAWVERGAYAPRWGEDALPEIPKWAKAHE